MGKARHNLSVAYRGADVATSLVRTVLLALQLVLQYSCWSPLGHSQFYAILSGSFLVVQQVGYEVQPILLELSSSIKLTTTTSLSRSTSAFWHRLCVSVKMGWRYEPYQFQSCRASHAICSLDQSTSETLKDKIKYTWHVSSKNHIWQKHTQQFL